jgi:archaeal ribosomal protein L23
MSLVIQHPLVTEKAMNEMDFENKLIFIVARDADKSTIAEAVSDRYDVEVIDVNTQLTADGKKKATVELGADDDATDIASRIGVF